MSDTLLTGWGRTAPSRSTVVSPLDVKAAAQSLAAAGPRGALVRGLGRSYGDAAQNGGGTVLDLAALREVSLDPVTGVADVGAGLSLDALLRHALPRGWFVPVTPGTRFVSVGGALAADVHGKNHHRDGSIGHHVRSLTLLTPAGEQLALSPSQDADAFEATLGGMGLTGAIVSARLAMIPVSSAWMSVDTRRVEDLDTLMAAMVDGDDRYRYSVAWIDATAGGARLGRGVLTRGDHAVPDQLDPARRADPLHYDPRGPVGLPPVVPPGLLNRLGVRAFNEAWFRKAPRRRDGEIQSVPAFFHPLDAVADWNRLYGRPGFVQYQFVVPDDAADLVREALTRLQAVGAASFLSVLKRFGPGGSGHLSFPAPGWTLALDVPASVPGLAAALDALDELVVAAGGRLYLAKDSRTRPELLPTMYPRLADWRAVRARLDPRGVLTSDLSRRLAL